jgi:hypothetical protein
VRIGISVVGQSTAGRAVQLSVQLLDVQGRPVGAESQTTVGLASNSGSGRFDLSATGLFSNATLPVIFSPGASSVTVFYQTCTPGVHTITGVDSPDLGLGDGQLLLDIVTGPATQIVLSPSSFSIVAGTTSTPVTIQLLDACGNPAPVPTNTNISVGSSSPAGSFTGTSNARVTTVTIPAGSSSTTVTYTDTRAGEHTVTGRPATGNALTPGTSAAEVTPAEISQLVITSTAGAFEPEEVSAPIVVESQDRFGNPSPSPERVQLDLATSSSQGRFDTTASGAFNGSITSVRLEIGTRAVTFFYIDGRLGTPTISITENPDRGWAAATQQRKIALKFAVNNLGRLGETTVDTGKLTTDGRLIVPSDDRSVVVLVEPKTKATTPDQKRVELVTVKRVDPPAIIEGQRHVGPVVDLEPNGTKFTVPIEISVRYNRDELAPGTSEKMLKIVLWTGTGWEPLESSVVDVANQIITAKLDHFSIYSVLDQEFETGGGDFPWAPLTGSLALFAAGCWFILAKWRGLVFLSKPYTLPVNQPSGEIRVKVRGFAGRYLNVKHAPMKIIIETDSKTGVFTKTPGGETLPGHIEMEIPVSQSEAAFYYQDSTPGKAKLSARAKGRAWKIGHQKTTVTPPQ